MIRLACNNRTAIGNWGSATLCARGSAGGDEIVRATRLQYWHLQRNCCRNKQWSREKTISNKLFILLLLIAMAEYGSNIQASSTDHIQPTQFYLNLDFCLLL